MQQVADLMHEALTSVLFFGRRSSDFIAISAVWLHFTLDLTSSMTKSLMPQLTAPCWFTLPAQSFAQEIFSSLSSLVKSKL